MSTDGPNARYLRVSLDCVFTADALARSWREGRVEPDEDLERDGRRLTFREACREDGFLRREIGPLPDTRPSRRRSWFAERRFRREAWRKVVENGELGPALLAERIDRLSHEVERLENRCATNDERLAVADRREKDLVAALRTGAADAEELEAICRACEDARTDGVGTDALGRGQARILERLASNVRQAFADIADGATKLLRKPDAKRIEQIVRFHNEATARVEEVRRGLADEKRKWSKELDRRKNDASDALQKAVESIQGAEKVAERQLEASVRNYRQSAALHSKWRETVERSFLENLISGNRFVIGNPVKMRPEWVSLALFSYAQTVPPDAVLGVFNGGWLDGARLGFLVAWDGVHWKLEADGDPGFLPWGWAGKIVAERGLFFGAKVYLENGFALGNLRRAGLDGEIEKFLARVQSTNESLPQPSFKNGGSESFRRMSSLAIRTIEDIASRKAPS